MSTVLSRKVISIYGEDSKKFLQGLITQNLIKADSKKYLTPLYSALLNNKGRYNFDFFIVKIAEDSYLIDIHEALAEPLLQIFTFYKLVSKVTVAIVPSLNVFSSLDSNYKNNSQQPLQELSTFNANVIKEGLLKGRLIFSDPRLPELGYRIITTEAFVENSISNQEYILLRYKNAVTEYPELKRDKTIPMVYGFDELNALSYNKGCYLGQEFTHSVKYKMKVRKRVVVINSAEISSNISPIITLNKNEEVIEVGKIIAKLQNYGLVVLDMRYAKEQLFYNNAPINLIIPKWVTEYSTD